jgi:hypothetical protein
LPGKERKVEGRGRGGDRSMDGFRARLSPMGTGAGTWSSSSTDEDDAVMSTPAIEKKPLEPINKNFGQLPKK